MMWDAAARKVRERGRRDPHGHARSTSLRWDKASAQWTITARTEHGETQDLHGRATSSPRRRSASCWPSLSPEPDCKAAADKLRYRDFLTVALIVEKPDLFPDNWIYIHDPAVKVGRIQNFRSWSPEMVPDPTSRCLGLEYFCFEGDGLWNATDGELIGLAKKELEQIGLADWNDIIDGCVVRQTKAYPVYDDDYKANVETIRAELAQNFPTLHLVGRNGMHKYNNQDHAMMTAMLTVKNIVAGEQRLRRLERQRGRRVPRGRRSRCARGARQRAAGAAARRGGVIDGDAHHRCTASWTSAHAS